MGCVQFLKFVIRTTRMCYRSVCSHPLTMGILLLLLFLYRSSPFLFSLFVSSSPVFVCTAVLLGTLLSFGEPNAVPEKTSYEFGLSKTIRVEGTVVVGDDEFCSSDNKYTDFKTELMSGSDGDVLADNADELHKCQKNHDGDVGFSLMYTDSDSREVVFEGQSVEEVKSEHENNVKIEQVLDSGGQLFWIGVDVGLSSSAEKVQNEEKEEYKSVDGSIDDQMGNHLVAYLESAKHKDFEHYKSPEGSLDVQIGDQLEQIRDQLEPSLASWQQLDGFDDTLFPSQELQEKRFENVKLGESSSEAQLSDYLESSLRSWKPVSSDHDEEDESDYGSDGAESSSPDASMADIIPMLDELHPLLDDEIPQTSNLSGHSSISTVVGSVKSPESSIYSEDESDHKEDEAADGKSDVGDENEEKTQARKDDSVTSAIMWTEDDQKNLMDLGTSELERNHRLESLIARRRARKMMADNNLIDFDEMDLPFPVAPISTRKQNPFDYPHESYDDLGLPPVPGSAPSIMLNRRNPFDLPYDSSEEKPDLTGDSFQEEFIEITRREVVNQREAMFRRNETFSMGSSAFDLARPSRFKPYFVPERTDSDGMSYSSLQSFQRQFSDLSESKASSVAETESTCIAADQEEKKQIDQCFVQEPEPSPEIEEASVLVQHGSQPSGDLNSLSCEEKGEKDLVLNARNLELGGASSSPAGSAYTPETGSSADNRLPHNEFSCAKKSWLSHNEGSHSDILMAEFVDEKHTTTSNSLSVPKVFNENKLEDVDSCLVNMEHNKVNCCTTAAIFKKCSLEPMVSDKSAEQALDACDFSHAIEVDNKHRKETKYDLSPLKKNHSLSSSDLQRETSGIDLCHLSSESSIVDVSYFHNDVARNISRLTEQDPDGNSLTMHDVGEGNTLDRTELFSELKQVSDNSLAEHIFSQRDYGETLVESNLYDSRTVDGMPSYDGRDFVEDSILGQQKNELVLLADDSFPVKSMLSCSQVESKFEALMEVEFNQQHNKVSSSRVVSQEGEENELFSSLDQNHIILHQSDLHDPLADLPMQLEHDIAFACQINGTSFHHEEKSIAEYIVDENHEISEGFIIDEPTFYLRKNEVKVVDEALISELDSVGDFRVLDVVPHIANSVAYSTDAVDYSIINQVHLNTEKPFVQKTYLADSTLVGKSKSDTGFSGATVADTMEPNLDSHAENVTTDFLVHAVQYNDDIDATLMEVREDTQRSVVVETFCSEFTGKEEISFPETELLLTEAEVGGCASGVGSASIDVAFHKSASFPGTEQCEHSLFERNDLHCDRRVPDPHPLLDAKIMEYSSEYAEKVVDGVDTTHAEVLKTAALTETELLLTEAEIEGCASGLGSATTDVAFHKIASVPGTAQHEHSLFEGNDFHCDRRGPAPHPLLDAQIMEYSCEYAEKVIDGVDTTYVEASKTTALTGADSMEFKPSLIEREIRKTEKTSITEAPEPRDQTDSAVSLVDRDFKQTDSILITGSITVPALELEDKAEGVGSMEFKSSQIDGETEETGKAPSAAPVLMSEDQTESTSSIEFESSQIDKDSKKTSKTPPVEATAVPLLQSRDQRDASQMNEDSKEIGETTLVAASIAAPDYQLRNISEGVGFKELKLPHTDGDAKEMDNNTCFFEASTAPVLEPRNQADGVGTTELESFRNINEIQESSLLALGSENGCETLEMPVYGAKIAPTIDPGNQRERITSEPLLVGKESKSIHKSILDGTNIISTLKSDSSQSDRADMDTMNFAAGQGIIAVAPESENQKGIVGSSVPLQLDINIPKIQGSPSVDAGIPLAHEPEEEKEFVGYPKSQQLQVNRGIEESTPLMMSEGQTARTAPAESESLGMHRNI